MAWFSLAIASYATLFLLTLAFPGALRPLGDLIRALGVLPVALVGIGSVWRVAGHPRCEPALRPGWHLLAISVTAAFLGVLFWRVAPHPWGTLGHVGWLLSYVGVFLALLRFSRVVNDHPGWRMPPFWLDVAIVAASVTVGIWYLLLGPVIYGHGWGGFGVLYSLADLVLLLAAVAFLLRSPRRLMRRVGAWLVVSTLCQFAARLALYFFTLRELLEPGQLRVVDGAAEVLLLLGFGSYLALSLAAWTQVWYADDRAESPHVWWDTLYHRLPYAALTLGIGLLVWATRSAWSSPAGGVVAGVSMVVFLTMARQVWVLRQNARLEAEAVARRGEARFRSMVQNSADVIAIIGAGGEVRYATPSIEKLVGVSPSSLHDYPLANLVHPDDLERVSAQWGVLLSRESGSIRLHFRVCGVEEAWRHVEAVFMNQCGDPDVGGVVVNLRDITERVTLEEQLAHQALHDSLTGLANRVLFQSRVEQALRRERRAPAGLAVLFLDLDDFKIVNDTLGHEAGDELLRTVARRLLAVTRESDTVARLGGDEFAILLTGIEAGERAALVAGRILSTLQSPLRLQGREVRVGGSIGIACGQPGKGVADLLRWADVAMYVAKRRGKGAFEFYADAMQAEVEERVELEEDLRQAVDRGCEEFELYCQPIVELNSGRTRIVEVLVRWRHPQRGLLMPEEFIPVAEETGLIVPLGRWILRAACGEAASWPRAAPDAGGRPDHSDPQPVVVSVNISRRQFEDPAFPDGVRAVLAEAGLPPERLLLEITESLLMHDDIRTVEILNSLKALGVRWAIDDFGTGYSSLHYLQRFPVDVLKIDRSFVHEVSTGRVAAALAQTVIRLGETLSMQTVAEGIEEEAQLRSLQAMGCSLGQGFLFARPFPLREIGRGRRGEGKTHAPSTPEPA